MNVMALDTIKTSASQFSTAGNNMADVETCEMGLILAPLNIGS
jgi:hypothetical protein